MASNGRKNGTLGNGIESDEDKIKKLKVEIWLCRPSSIKNCFSAEGAWGFGENESWLGEVEHCSNEGDQGINW